MGKDGRDDDIRKGLQARVATAAPPIPLQCPLYLCPPLEALEEGVPPLTLGLEGDHQRSNAALALQLARCWLQQKDHQGKWAGRWAGRGHVEPASEGSEHIQPHIFLPGPQVSGRRRRPGQASCGGCLWHPCSSPHPTCGTVSWTFLPSRFLQIVLPVSCSRGGGNSRWCPRERTQVRTRP